MKELRITIEIDAEGRITADADGFTGDACLETINTLLEGLSPGAAELERKPDAAPAHRRALRTQKLGRKS